MVKEIAISKRAKISQAQQYVLLAVLGASLFLGATIALIMFFSHQISFNTEVIIEQDKAIAAYSDAISGIGICKKPSGDVYNNDELKKCIPEAIEVSSIPGTLRANILENMAANKALNSVQKENNDGCINPATNKSYTYSEMADLYDSAITSEQLAAASKLIQTCSALRVIPDALPAFKNEEALLASLNKIFIISNWQPESLSPAGNAGSSNIGSGLMTFSVRLGVSADAATTIKFLDNVERSIREFNISRASISIDNNGNLDLQAQATAYYMSPTTITETTKTIKSGDNEQ